jgi:vacuolar-type H+-ATPase subunit F/Vma7
MNRIVGIGATHEIEGFALAGVNVIPASTDAEVTAAWAGLGRDVGLVVLSPAAARGLQDRHGSRQDLLTVVMP